ncbi:MAG: 3-dehydroquinate synthase [Microgenomates group bacterium GW2011_GWA2_37_6]|nr:MAG: 3-dehydroquinate synthase [Microgenomates group bacterium GW2011_GWA2_37_6]
MHFSQNLDKYDYASEETLDILSKSSSIKAKICEELNNKKIRLLYGHAVGHAYEKLTEGHRRHGDCIAIGMIIEGALSVVLGLWNKEEWNSLDKLVTDFKLPNRLPENTKLDGLLSKMLHYKKLVDRDNYFFCLPDRIGHINNQESSCLTPIKKTEMKEILIQALSWTKDASHV